MTLEEVNSFAHANILWLLLALAVITVVISILKTVMKWVITLIIVGTIIVSGVNYEPPSKTLGQLALQEVKNRDQKEVLRVFINEGNSAKYKSTGNNSYVLTAGGVVITGKKGSKTLKLTYQGEEKTLVMSERLEVYIESLQK